MKFPREHSLHTGGVTGSIPVAPTIKPQQNQGLERGLLPFPPRLDHEQTAKSPTRVGENRGKVFPERSRGRAPPGRQNGKAADAANVHGLNGVATLQSSNPATLAHADSEIKRSRADWRAFYDNARGNIDHALKELYRAWGNGLLTDPEAAGIEAGLRSQQARLQRRQAGPSGIAAVLANGKSKLALGWTRRRPRRSPDREKSRQRARTLGGSAHMPPRIRSAYTECERAVLFIVAREVKRNGVCDLAVGRIAAEAGVCVRTVQNAVAEAVRQGHLCREERERNGRKNLTNILRIVSREWLAWIKRGSTGCKVFTATKSVDSRKEGRSRSTGDRWPSLHPSEGRPQGPTYDRSVTFAVAFDEGNGPAV